MFDLGTQGAFSRLRQVCVYERFANSSNIRTSGLVHKGIDILMFQ